MPEMLFDKKGHLEPQVGDYLVFNGHTLTLHAEDGRVKEFWPATSGKPGWQDPQFQNLYGKGPIPEGKYVIRPDEIDHYHWFDPRDWDWAGADNRRAWGKNRVPLYPSVFTKMSQLSQEIERGNFFIHGGTEPGSARCIDLTTYAEDFFKSLKKYDWPIDVYVRY